MINLNQAHDLFSRCVSEVQQEVTGRPVLNVTQFTDLRDSRDRTPEMFCIMYRLLTEL